VCTVCVCADGPHIDCESLDVELSQRNACLRCYVSARPPPTSVYWLLDDNNTNTDVIADVTHWVVVQVDSHSSVFWTFCAWAALTIENNKNKTRNLVFARIADRAGWQ